MSQAKKKLPFNLWLSTTNRIEVERYYITPEDGGFSRDDLLHLYDQGMKPKEFVEWWGNKYDLDRRMA